MRGGSQGQRCGGSAAANEPNGAPGGSFLGSPFSANTSLMEVIFLLSTSVRGPLVPAPEGTPRSGKLRTKIARNAVGRFQWVAISATPSWGTKDLVSTKDLAQNLPASEFVLCVAFALTLPDFRPLSDLARAGGDDLGLLTGP